MCRLAPNLGLCGQKDVDIMDDALTTQPTILVLDHDRARSAARCGQLASHGWHARQARSLTEAIELLKGHPVDLALAYTSPGAAAAQNMPGQLQQAGGGSFLPVIVIHDEPASEKDRCACLDSGADEVVPASTGSAELWARMRALLRIKDLQDALDESRLALKDALRRQQELETALRADNERLNKLAITDPLTRLYNRRYFERFLTDEFKITKRYGQSLGLLTLDLDHFKMVNDQHGHPTGDFVLKEFAVIVRQSIRESDVASRTGGEEFAIILPRADRAQTDNFARRIRQTVADHVFDTGSAKINITCSIGLACYGSDADVITPDHLMYFADQALYAAKQAGRNCIVHWFEMDSLVKARVRSQVRQVLNAEEPAPTTH
jgi:two-component system, cell cycle response regulator